MKKVLILASVASMIDQFNMPNIELLQSMGYEVHVACNFIDGNTCNREKINILKKELREKGVVAPGGKNVYTISKNKYTNSMYIVNNMTK